MFLPTLLLEMFVLHARLRNKCRSHFHNNPLCDLCDVAEDASHYPFQCRNFSVERQDFNNTGRRFQPLNANVIFFMTIQFGIVKCGLF